MTTKKSQIKDWELGLENKLIDLDTGVRDLDWTTNRLKTFIQDLLSSAVKEAEVRTREEVIEDYENRIKKLAGTYLLPIDTDYLLSELQSNKDMEDVITKAAIESTEEQNKLMKRTS